MLNWVHGSGMSLSLCLIGPLSRTQFLECSRHHTNLVSGHVRVGEIFSRQNQCWPSSDCVQDTDVCRPCVQRILKRTKAEVGSDSVSVGTLKLLLDARWRGNVAILQDPTALTIQEKQTSLWNLSICPATVSWRRYCLSSPQCILLPVSETYFIL